MVKVAPGVVPTLTDPWSRPRADGLHVIRRHHRPEARLGHELVEGGPQVGEGPVVIQMVRLDVGQHGPVGTQRLEGPEALVGLHHQPLAAVPYGVGADLVHVGPDDEGGAQARLDEDQREHRRRGGLALRSGHGQTAAGGTDGGQHPGAGHHPGAPLGGRHDLDVGGRARRASR